MKTKTTLIIAALAVILGVVFATWSEEATIQINAETGYIDLDFTSVTNTACSSSMGCSNTPPANSVVHSNDGAPEVTLTLNNAYPGATATYEIVVYNDGTLPVNVACSVTAPPELYVNVNPPSYNNLLPGQSYTLTVEITVGDVDEDHSYAATVACTYTQAVPSGGGGGGGGGGGTGYDIDFTKVKRTSCTGGMSCNYTDPINSEVGVDDGQPYVTLTLTNVTLTLTNAKKNAHAVYQIWVYNDGNQAVDVSCYATPVTGPVTGLDITLAPSSHPNLQPGNGYELTVNIGVNEAATAYSVTVTCTYTLHST